ncbi:MAG: flippase [Patescibacteria group bacterium]
MINRLKELLFQNKSTRQTIIKNTFWLSVSQVGSRLIRATIIIYAARVLGAAEYGIFSYALGLAGFFTIFADLGVSPLMTREIAGHPEKKAIYFINAFWIKNLLLATTAVLIIFVAPKFSNIKEAAALIPFIALLVIFDNFRDFVFHYFRGIEKMEREAFLTVIINVAIALTGFIILRFYQTAGALLFAYITSVAILSTVAFYFVKNIVKGIFKNFDKKIALQFFHDCWPFAFTGLFGIFMLNIDIVMLGWWRNAEEIGYYSASQRIVQIFYTMPAIIASAAFPAMTQFIKQGELDRARNLNEKLIVILYLIAIPLAIGGIILSSPLIKFVFEGTYLPAAASFKILIASLLIQFPGAVLGNLIMAHNQQKKLVSYVIVGSLSNVIFNVLLIPKYGISGAAIATLISQFIYFTPVWFKIKKLSNFHTLRYLKKIIASAIIMGFFSYILNYFGLNVIINIIISSGIYFGILYTLKEDTINEIKDLFAKMKL